MASKLSLFLAELAVAALLFAIPAESAAQTSTADRGGWVALGMGGSLVRRSVERIGSVELALQRGSNMLAVRSLGINRNSDAFRVWEVVELLYGRAKWLGTKRVSVAFGLSWTCVSYPSEPSADPGESGTVNPHKDVIGIPIVVEASLSPSRSLGAGVQAFGNLNSAESFIGVALVAKVGSLRGSGSGK